MKNDNINLCLYFVRFSLVYIFYNIIITHLYSILYILSMNNNLYIHLFFSCLTLLCSGNKVKLNHKFEMPRANHASNTRGIVKNPLTCHFKSFSSQSYVYFLSTLKRLRPLSCYYFSTKFQYFTSFIS